MNMADEVLPLKAEESFFAENPRAGKFISYSVIGDTISADLVPAQTVQPLASSLSVRSSAFALSKLFR